jgi:hypothetical protein
MDCGSCAPVIPSARPPDMRRLTLPSLIETISFLFLMAVIAGGFAIAPGLDAAFTSPRIDAQ